MNSYWQNKIVPILTHPVMALHGIMFLAINLGLLKVFTALISERRRSLESDFRMILSELALVVFVVALIAGAMAVVYKLLGTPRPAVPDEENFKQRINRWLNDPFFLLDVGIYAVAYFGLIATVLLMIEVSGFGPVSVWSWWSTQMFYMLTGVLVLLAVRALADAVGVAAVAAPSGGAGEDDEPEKEGTDSEGKAESEPSGPGLGDRLSRHVATWQLQSRYGLIALAYLGALFFVLDMWNWRDFTPNGIWWNFFFELATVLGAVGVVLLLTRLVEVASHTEHPDSEDDSATMANQMAAKLLDPGKAALMVTVAMAATAGAWSLMNIWLARNQNVLDFWAEVTWSLHFAVPAVALPFVLWTLWRILATNTAQSAGSLLFDPYRQLTLVIYLIAYLGMVDLVFHAWDGRDRNPARIWDTLGEDLFNVVARVAIFVALRAIVAAVVIGKNPVVAGVEPSVKTETAGESEPA